MLWREGVARLSTTNSAQHTLNALKFGTAGEVDPKEGMAHAEGLLLPPPNCSEVGAPQVELDGAVGNALTLQPPLQRPRTKADIRRQDRRPIFGLIEPLNRLKSLLMLML